MKIFVMLCLLLFAAAVSARSHAQAACPPGWVPYSATSCGPDNSSQHQQQEYQPTQPQWESRWGAIATDADKGIIGVATRKLNESTAKNAAMIDCRNKGGANCILQMPFSNGCAALIVGDSVFNVVADDTVDRASQAGISQCSRSSANCHVYFSTCSPAVRTH